MHITSKLLFHLLLLLRCQYKFLTIPKPPPSTSIPTSTVIPCATTPPPQSISQLISTTLTSPIFFGILQSQNSEDPVISSQSTNLVNYEVIELGDMDKTIEDFNFGPIPYDKATKDMPDDAIMFGY